MNSIGWIEPFVQDLRYACPSTPPQRRLCRRGGRPRSASASVARPPCSASFSQCCSRRCLTKRPDSWFASTSRSPDNPDTRGILAGTHFTFLRDHATAFEDVAAVATIARPGSILHREPRRAPQRPARVERLLQRASLAAPAWPRLRTRRRQGYAARRAQRRGLANLLRHRSFHSRRHDSPEW